MLLFWLLFPNNELVWLLLLILELVLLNNPFELFPNNDPEVLLLPNKLPLFWLFCKFFPNNVELLFVLVPNKRVEDCPLLFPNNPPPALLFPNNPPLELLLFWVFPNNPLLELLLFAAFSNNPPPDLLLLFILFPNNPPPELLLFILFPNNPPPELLL